MDDGLKQRLIGAIVLLALAIIFIPVLFDRDRISSVDKTTQIPAVKHIESITINAPRLEETQDTAKKSDTIFIADEEKVVADDPEPPALTTKGTPKAWVLQIGSFREKVRAESLRDTLQKESYKVYLREVKTQQGTMYRVYIGPKIDKSRLLDEQKTLKSKYKIDSLLLNYEA